MDRVSNLGDNVGLGDGGFDVPTFLEKKPIEMNESKERCRLTVNTREQKLKERVFIVVKVIWDGNR